MTYFILKIVLSNMNRLMSSQEPVVILNLTDIRGSSSTFIHYVQRGPERLHSYFQQIYPLLETESHFIAQASLECTTMLLPLPPEDALPTQLTSTL